MKKYIILITTFLITAAMNAQVDRSIQPKPGPAPKINLETPATFTCRNGLQVLVVEDHKLPKVTVSLRIDNDPIAEGNKTGTSDLTGSILGSGSQKITKTNFDEEVDFLGARVSFNASGAYASSLTKYFPRVFELMADAALHPKFTQDEFDKITNQMRDGIKSESKSVSAVANRLRKAIGYGKEHPFGEFLTEKTLDNITITDVKNFYDKYYRPNNAYLVIVGDITVKEAKKLTRKHFKKWKKGKFIPATFKAPKNVDKTEINFADMPNAVQSEVAVVSTTNLKMSDPDYHAVLLANQILGGDFNSYLNMNLREAHGYTYGARSSINANKYTSMFRTSAKVRNAVTDSTVIQTMKELKRIRTEKVEADVLKNVKAGYVGKFVLALERSQTVANYALNIKTKDLPEDFYKTYLQKINDVTVEDIQRVSKKYFSEDNARIVVIGKALDVLPNLEKLPYKITYYDTQAEVTDKPELSKPVPAGVTTQTVVDNFVKAIGGKAKVDAVNSTSLLYEASMQGQVLTMNIKAQAPNKKAMTMGMMGMTMAKNVFNGVTGYSEQQGQKKDLEGDKLEEMKSSSSPFDELAITTSGTLKGIEPFDGKDLYKIAIGNKMAYFGVESGLKVMDVITTKVGEKEMSQTISYGDYKATNGVLFPGKMTISFGPQNLDFILKEVKINDGVSDSDFE
ncbi:MAG: pitrilysin family protein [Flavobacteriaceae bacterium]